MHTGDDLASAGAHARKAADAAGKGAYAAVYKDYIDPVSRLEGAGEEAAPGARCWNGRCSWLVQLHNTLLPKQLAR
jgi:hypothetical protein